MKKPILFALFLSLLSSSFLSCSCSNEEAAIEITFHFPYFGEEAIEEVYLFDNVTITTEDQSEKIYFDKDIEEGKYQAILISEESYYLASIRLEDSLVIVDYDLPIIKIIRRFKFAFFSRNSTCGLVYVEDFREKQNEFLGKDTNYDVGEKIVTIKRRDIDSKMKTYEYKVGRILQKSDEDISRDDYIKIAEKLTSKKNQPSSDLKLNEKDTWEKLRNTDSQYKLMRFLLGQEIFRQIEFDDILISSRCKVLFENQSEKTFDFEELITEDVYQIIVPTYDQIFLFKIKGLFSGPDMFFYTDLEPIKSFKKNQTDQGTINVVTYEITDLKNLKEIKTESENGYIEINEDFFELNLGNNLFLFSLLN